MSSSYLHISLWYKFILSELITMENPIWVLFSEMSLFVQVGITLLFQLVGLIGFFSRKKCNFYYEISIIEIDSRKLGTFIVKKIINTN
jgi:hypothetical protein